MLNLRCGQVGQLAQQPLVVFAQAGGVVVLQALRDLHQKHAADAAAVQQREQFVELGVAEALDAVADEVGDFARGLVGGQAFGEAPQVLDQHDAQRGRQCPEFAQRQLAGLLVGGEKVREQVFVERAVGVRDEGPGHPIDTRQAGQRFVDQHRQVAEVTPRQAVVNLLELALDQVKVVEQPLGGRAHLVAGAGLRADVGLRLAQGADVVAEPREKRGAAAGGDVGAVRRAEAAAVLGETFRTEDFGAVRRFDGAAAAVEDVDQCFGCVRNQSEQRGRLRHAACFKAPAPRRR